MSTKKKENNSHAKVKSRQQYSEAFKRQIVEEFESGLYSKADLKRKYAIAGHSSLSRWLKKYGKLRYQSYYSIGRPMKDKNLQYIKELEAKLAKQEQEFKKVLNHKDAEIQAVQKFIEIAERELDIKIVKKSGTKQSKK